MDAARLWLGELLGDLGATGYVWLATKDATGWHESGPFRHDRLGLTPAPVDHAALLDLLARSAVAASDAGADVFASPYPHGGLGRRKAGARLRRHVHADVDGPLNLPRVRFIRGFAVASGSVAEDGTSHGHVYVRLSRSVEAHEHEALCRALAVHVGGDFADLSKVADHDVLRPPGTLNHKGAPPRPVEWLIRPDAEQVLTWDPEDLAALLGVAWPVTELALAPTEPGSLGTSERTPDPQSGDVRRRLAGLVQAVTDAPTGQGNARLNWAAGVAAALCATHPDTPSADDVRGELVDAFLTRPTPRGESVRGRRAEAERTAASGWRWGAAHPAEALADRPRPSSGHQDDHEEAAAVALGTELDDDAEEQGKDAQSIEEHRAGVQRRFPLANLAALVDPDRPARRWLLAGVVPEGDHASLVAPAGTGKSLFALALAVAAAQGADSFCGRALSFSGRVLYVDMENSEDDLSERLTDLGVTPDNVVAVADRLLLLHLPQLRGLDTPAGGTDMLDLLDAYGLGAGDLVVLDSTQRVTSGEENSNDTLRALYRHTATQLKRREVTVLRTDNTGWNGDRERGASAKRDDVGYAWLLLPDPKDKDVFVLTQAKHRARPGQDAERLIFRRAMTAGRLTFIPAQSTFGDRMADTRALLDRLGVAPGAGLNAAWKAVKEAKDDGDAPDWITRNMVRQAQEERQVKTNLHLVDSAHDPAGPTHDRPDEGGTR